MTLTTKQRKLLDRLYKDIHSPAAYTSVEPLLREVQKQNKEITREEVKEYLASQNVYTLHRRAVRKYRRMPTLAAGLHTEWQADLAIFDRLSKQNKGYKYLLVCIDTLSRQLFVEPVKSKHAENMVDAFKNLFKRAGVIPWKLVTDQGREFTAKTVQNYFSSIELQHFSIFTSPQFHAGMAERANRSIKERLYRLFTERQTQRWIDVVQDIVNAINNSPNSSIDGMRPVDVTYDNAEKLRHSLKEKAEEIFGKRRWREQRFQVGDVVRIEKHKHIFQKGYLPNFTSELFIVDRIRLVPSQPPTYKIRDMDGEIIQGWFYANDLCRFQQRKEKGKLYKIEKIIKKQKRNGAEYVYVKWRGYGPSSNSWIAASTVETI